MKNAHRHSQSGERGMKKGESHSKIQDTNVCTHRQRQNKNRTKNKQKRFARKKV